MNIAICDDDIKFCSQLEALIMQYGSALKINLEIDVFYSGEGLYQYLLNQNHYDIIFLDIEMYKMNGIELGLHIRNLLDDELVKIIYISAYKDYVFDVFPIRPIGFILKPYTVSKIHEMLDISIRLLSKYNSIFKFQFNKESYAIPYNDIYYFESNNKQVIIIHKNGETPFYDKISALYERIADSRFIRIHRSYIININHISFIKGNTITMSNSRNIQIAARRKAELFQFLKEKEVHPYE